jgi:signal peptidase II
MMNRQKFVIVLALTFDSVVILDRVSKIIFMTTPAIRGKFILGSLLQTIEHRNYGIIANIPLPLAGIFLATFMALVLIAIGLIRAWRDQNLRAAMPLILILGGAIGNLWDRILYGYVYDWLLLFGRSAINIADISIFIGLIWYFFQPKPPLPTSNVGCPTSDD